MAGDCMHRGEVAFRLGERDLCLKLDWAAVATLATEWRQDGEQTIDNQWAAQLARAIDDYELSKVARFIAVAARHHHPEITVEQVMAGSPAWSTTFRAVQDLTAWFSLGPENAAEAGKSTAPFAAIWSLWRTLSQPAPPTASPSPSSGP